MQFLHSSRKLIFVLILSLLLNQCGPSMRELYDQAQHGNNAAKFEYARRLMSESDKNEIASRQEAFTLFEQCALCGNANAALALGICYEYGKVVPVNEERAIHYYKQAGMKGKMKAYLAIIKLAKKRSDHKLVTECLGKLADFRIIEYQIRYAIALSEGNGCQIDLLKATDYWRYAALAGSSEAMLMMGINYLEGNGVRRNETLAKSWCKMSARLKLDLADKMLDYIEKSHNESSDPNEL